MKNIDLGNNHTYHFFQWSPERDINPQYEGIPDIPKAGITITHINKKDGSECSSACVFDSESARKVFGDRPYWKLENLDPLTISPSILCKRCGDHGFIRNGRWEVA